jgi:hypothetical protein
MENTSKADHRCHLLRLSKDVSILPDVSRDVGGTEFEDVLKASGAYIDKRRLNIQEVVIHPLRLFGTIVVNNLRNDRLIAISGWKKNQK